MSTTALDLLDGLSDMDMETDESQNEIIYTITDEEVHRIAKSFLDDSQCIDSDVEDSALSYYMGDPRGDEIIGRSQFISTDVADMVEACLSQMTPMLTNRNLVSFDALSEQDERQVAIESRVCNNIVMSQNNGYVKLHSAIKSGLLSRISAIEVLVDETPYITEESYEGLNSAEFLQILQPRVPNEQVVVISQGLNDNSEFVDVTLKRVITDKKIILDAVKADKVHYINNTSSECPEDLVFIAIERHMTRTELLDMGYNAERIAEAPVFSGGLKASSTSSKARTITHKQEQLASDTIQVFFCYTMVDMHDSGQAERRRVVLAGSDGEHFIDQESVGRVPVAVGSPFLMPGEIEGLGVYDKLKTVQDGKTSGIRQWLDNQNANNNRRLAVDVKGIHDPDSLYESKPGGVIKCKRPPGDVVFPVPVNDIGPSCLTLLEYLDRVTAQRAGAALDMQTEQQNVNGESAHGVERMMSAKELITAMIARNLAETMIKQLYAIVRYIVRTEFAEPQQVKLNQDWLITNPGMWIPERTITINVGDTPSKKREKYNILTQVLANQMQLVGTGSTLVTPEKIHNTLSDMVILGLEQEPSRYYVDPMSQQGQMAAQSAQQNAMQEKMKQEKMMLEQIQMQKTLAQAEMVKAQAAMQKNKMQLLIDGLKHQLETLKASSEEGTNIADLAFRYDELYSTLAVEIAKLEVQSKQQEEANVQQNKKAVANG